MAIYKRCPKCYKDNTLAVRHCVKCKAVLVGKYCVRVKDPMTAKWRTKVVPMLKTAREVELRFKTSSINEVLFPKIEEGIQEEKGVSFEAYIEYAKIHKKTWRDDHQRWNQHIADKDHTTREGVLKIIGGLTASKKYQPATIEQILKLMRRVYNWHRLVYGWPVSNPCEGVKVARYDNRVSNPLSIGEASKLIGYLKTVENRRVAMIVLFALVTGRRKGEILSLKWSDTNFDLEIITCRNTKNGSSLSFPLNRLAMEVLVEAKGLKISDFVFPSGVGTYYKNCFNNAWSRLRKHLVTDGVFEGHVRFHDLRHTYATHLASSGEVDIYTLKKLLGHKDITLTERYAHLIDKRLRACTVVQDSLY